MKKSNSRYHSNNNNSNNNYNSIYSLNYKFDSISPAGKTCGTALDLIKKYNDLAKEAHGNGDYVASEVFRQYAEHYRKIVTEINERKNQRQAAFNNAAAPVENMAETPVPAAAAEPIRAEIEPVSPAAPVAPVPAAPAAPTPNQPSTNRPRQRRRDIQAAAGGQTAADTAVAAAEPAAEPAPAKREFKVIEISHADSKAELITEAKPRTPRTPRRKTLSVAML